MSDNAPLTDHATDEPVGANDEAVQEALVPYILHMLATVIGCGRTPDQALALVRGMLDDFESSDEYKRAQAEAGCR